MCVDLVTRMHSLTSFLSHLIQSHLFHLNCETFFSRFLRILQPTLQMIGLVLVINVGTTTHLYLTNSQIFVCVQNSESAVALLIQNLDFVLM